MSQWILFLKSLLLNLVYQSLCLLYYMVLLWTVRSRHIREKRHSKQTPRNNGSKKKYTQNSGNIRNKAVIQIYSIGPILFIKINVTSLITITCILGVPDKVYIYDTDRQRLTHIHQTSTIMRFLEGEEYLFLKILLMD